MHQPDNSDDGYTPGETITMPTGFTGGCACGAIRYRVSGTPIVVSHCHCHDCRRASGAPFVTWMTLFSSDFSFTDGTPKVYRSSPDVSRAFCGDCGTALTYRHDDHPEEIDITAASLDDPTRITPEDHIWTASMLPWLSFSDNLPRLRETHWAEGYRQREA